MPALYFLPIPRVFSFSSLIQAAKAQAPVIECGADSVLIGCNSAAGTVATPGSAAFGTLIVNTISSIITIFAIITVLFIIKGGLSLVFSFGNDEKLKSARNTVLYAVLGLTLAILSYAIVSIVTGIRLF